MTTAGCGDYSLLTPPPTDCHRAVRAGPVSALLYDDYDAAVAMPLHHRGPYNLTCYTPTDLRHHHHQQQQQQSHQMSSSSSSSYQYSRTPVVDRRQPSTFHDTRQLGSTTATGSTASISADPSHYSSQRCDPSGTYQTADGPYSYATPIGAAGRCLPGIGSGGGGLQRPMSGAEVALQPDVLSPAYSPYGGGRCLPASSSSSSSSLLMRPMPGCCVSGYCSPTGPCRCAEQLYEHDAVTVNGTGHISGDHVSCRLQHHHHQQQQHPHQSAGTYKWMMIKRSSPKTMSSGLHHFTSYNRYTPTFVLQPWQGP